MTPHIPQHEVVAALIIQSQKILLGLRAANRAFYPDVWDLFGGHVESGEQRDEALVRELKEELDITPTEWKYLETLHVASASLTVHLYLVTAWAGTPVNRQPDEHSAIGWFSLAEATQLKLADELYPRVFARFVTLE